MFRFAVGIIFLASQVFALKYTDCGSKTGRIIEVRISGCEETDVCELKRGESYTYGLTFESLKDSEKLTTHVSGIVAGVTYPYPLPNPNTCETEDIECPIVSGQTYEFDNSFEVKKNYPQMQLDIKWELKDDDKEDVVCGIVGVKIV